VLKKNQAPRLNPDSTMGIVYRSISNFEKTKEDVVRDTGLRVGQVKSALHNLVFVGLLSFDKDDSGRIVYIAVCDKEDKHRCGAFCDGWSGASSVFGFNALPNDRIDTSV
jgi:hypothetical protein